MHKLTVRKIREMALYIRILIAVFFVSVLTLSLTFTVADNDLY